MRDLNVTKSCFRKIVAIEVNDDISLLFEPWNQYNKVPNTSKISNIIFNVNF